MTGAGTPNSNFAGTLNTPIYYATTLESATPLELHPHTPHPLALPLIAGGDTLYRGIGLAHPL
tara:strand:+ start:72 stop:260 length:189 start_codon:yes stop_codon:yes gene_type:complete